MTTITHTLNIPGNGLFNAGSRQARFLRASKSYNPNIDPRLPKHTFLSEPFADTDTVIVLSSIATAPIPNELSGTIGAIRLGEEVMFYSQVFESNSSLLITQRTVANTARVTSYYSVSAGTIVSLLGLRTV